MSNIVERGPVREYGRFGAFIDDLSYRNAVMAEGIQTTL